MSEVGLSRAQETEKENMASQAEKQEKANWMPREPGLGDKTQAETLPQVRTQWNDMCLVLKIMIVSEDPVSTNAGGK